MHTKHLLFILVFTFTTLVFSQNTSKIEAFSKRNNAQISLNKTNGMPKFIRFSKEAAYTIKGNTSRTKALNFINESQLFKNQKSEDFRYLKSEIDKYGFSHITLEQTHKNVPVFDGKLKFHFNAENQISAINGNVIPDIKINTTPFISKIKAEQIAIDAINNQNINHSRVPLFIEKNDVFIYPIGIVKGIIESHHLAYYIEVRNNVDVREYVFVDAHTGKIIDQFTGIAHAINRIVYEEDTSTVVWQEGDPFPGSLTIWQQNEVEASAHTYNFFNNAFGYASYDGADGIMRTINNNLNISCPNANWNGFSANYCDGTASDDVIAHEWGHAYTDYTNNLIYAWQSGAINEAYSDIWGETIDLLNNYQDTDDDHSLRSACASSDRWHIGEDASAFGGAIRDMWDPTCANDPGKVSDTQYWCNTGDSGGVHINSGVPNHAYVLLVDGGNYNGYTINSIGFTKAAHIFWRAQKEYLTATSGFLELADALETSASDLLGINLEGLSTTSTPAGPSGEIISASDVQQVVNTMLAVEMRMSPDFCNFEPLLNESANVCGAANTNPLWSEDWETGMDGWTVEQLPVNAATWEARDWVLESSLPKGRAGTGMFGTDPINGNCSSDLENGILRLQSPEITIPSYSTGVNEMSINHYVSTETNWDGVNIKYNLDNSGWQLLPGSAFIANAYNGTINSSSIGNDNPMEGEDAFTGSDEGSVTGSWGTSVIDLSQLGVQENSIIQFRFEVGTDGCNGRQGWYLDEMVIYNCNFALSVEEYSSLQDVISIYPNPTDGVFNLKKQSQVDLTLANIYDINGRLIKTVDLSNIYIETQLHIEDFASGLYFIEVNAMDSKFTFKVIKN